ncbi:MAG: TnpV protein [Clostridia bacterium]|nr:TnpV protein [Clostridia bacterium]
MMLNYTTAKDGIQYPTLTLPEQKNLPIGKYGQMRLEFLKKHRRGTYTTLLTEARLTEHLHEMDETARAQISEIMSQQATSLGVTEQMKAENPMTWAQMMNNIKASAEETVLNTLIYT